MKLKPQVKKQEPREIVPYDELRRQQAMTLDEQKKLISSQSPLTDAGARMAIEAARAIGVPLQGINVIPTRNGMMPYVNSVGIRYKYHTDKRGFKSASSEILHVPSGEGDVAIVKGRVEFMDGSFGENIGAVIVDKQWNTANALMKAATKAIRRAGQDAVEITLPIYEDYIEYREEQMKDITPVAGIGNGAGDPTTLAQFLNKLAGAGIDTDDACKRLKVSQITEVKEFEKAWETLKPKE